MGMGRSGDNQMNPGILNQTQGFQALFRAFVRSRTNVEQKKLFGIMEGSEITNPKAGGQNPDFRRRHENVSAQSSAELRASGHAVLYQSVPDDPDQAGKPETTAILQVVVDSQRSHRIPSRNDPIDHDTVRMNLLDKAGPMPKPNGDIFFPAVRTAVPDGPKPRVKLAGKAVVNFLELRLTRASEMDFVPLLQKSLDDGVEEGVDAIRSAQGISTGKKDSHDINVLGPGPMKKIGVLSKLLVPLVLYLLIIVLS